MQNRVSWCLAFLYFLAATTPAFPQDSKKFVELVRQHIDQMPNGKGAGEVTLQTAPAVKKVFPDHHMVLVRFRIFPVARVMPEGLRPSNVFAVSMDGKITHLKDVKAMENYFRTQQAAVKTDNDAKNILAAWLTLTQEFHQDGFFKFEVLEKEFVIVQDGDQIARGRLVAMQGGNGELAVSLSFDKDGKLARVSEKATIRPGPRPVCQATKLLDADPIVRRIAEQDLLIMGLSARDYLMEQRRIATPELRTAIDRLWQKIQKNGW